MRVPPELEPLLDAGLIDDVLRPLMSGKEAQVYLVSVDGGDLRVAKVYKDAGRRSFKHRADYLEGRRGRNTRSERAKGKRSAYGRREIEASWRSAEYDAMRRLWRAGVRVPEPYDFVDGVLIMELVRGPDGDPAPRLVDVDLEEGEARRLFNQLLGEVTRMLCAGLVHGDLSDFNVLLGHRGPTIIDFPQAIDAAANQNARRLLIRDVDNLTSFLARWVPDLRRRPYGEELWNHYERATLTPDTRLTGRLRRSSKKANLESVMDEISAAIKEERRRRTALGLPPVRRRSTAASVTVPKTKSRRPPPPSDSASADDLFSDLDALLIAED
ncbi:MAG: PA4780 family RIO1-like protein kinase [Myxococcota bacterium]